jgi:hypothetical protein
MRQAQICQLQLPGSGLDLTVFGNHAQSRMRVVIGRAIPVPTVQDPSHELIEEYLQRFISSWWAPNSSSSGTSRGQLRPPNDLWGDALHRYEDSDDL